MNSRTDSLPDLVARITAERADGVSDAVDEAKAEYIDPRRDDVARLEGLQGFLQGLAAAAPTAEDLRRLMALRDATDGATAAALGRVEDTLRACLLLLPELRPTVVMALDMDDEVQRWIDETIERGEAGSASEVLTRALDAVIAGELVLPKPTEDEARDAGA
jgi:hypothetical protein